MAENLREEGALPLCPTAEETARRVRRGAHAAEVCAAALERIARTEPRVRAWRFLDGPAALERAAALNGSPEQAALAGVPVGVKDIVDTADMPTENGTPLDAGRRPRSDAAVVRRLRAAGATILGKTVTTELACGASGETRNPHALAHTPGGSSSGSAAAVAAGHVPLALGTQTAGSVVRPAAFCGVWGMKPSFGTIPRTGVLALAHSLDHLGVFARTARDIARAVDVLSGDDGADPAAAGRASTGLLRALAAPLAKPRLAFMKEPAWHEVEPDAVRRWEAAAARLGAEPLALGPAFADSARVQLGIMRRELAHHLAPWFARGEAQLSERLRGHGEAGRAISAGAYLALQDEAAALRRAFAAALHGYDAALTPPAPGIAPVGLAFTGSRMQTMLWTLLGVPAVNVPTLAGAGGLPLGLQVVGRFGADAAVLRAALWCAARLGGEGDLAWTPAGGPAP